MAAGWAVREQSPEHSEHAVAKPGSRVQLARSAGKAAVQLVRSVGPVDFRPAPAWEMAQVDFWVCRACGSDESDWSGRVKEHLGPAGVFRIEPCSLSVASPYVAFQASWAVLTDEVTERVARRLIQDG